MNQHLISIQTAGGAVVEVTASEVQWGRADGEAVCGGCPSRRSFSLYQVVSPDGDYLDWKPLRKWAEGHADTCRGLPRR